MDLHYKMNGGAIVFDGTNECAVSALNQSFFQEQNYSYSDTLGGL